MSVLVLLLALALLMHVAYRGLSVIALAPLCALLAVAASHGLHQVLPFYTNVFMASLVDFVKLYFPVFMLGAIFGKMMELSGAAAAIAQAIVRLVGPSRSVLAIVLACAVLTYGGVSLFVVAFAVYPLAASLFATARLSRRLIPGTIALGSFTFTMDSLPGTPQIQNVIPTTFFGTNLYAAPVLGCLGAMFVLGCGLAYLHGRAKALAAEGAAASVASAAEPPLVSPLEASPATDGAAGETLRPEEEGPGQVGQSLGVPLLGSSAETLPAPWLALLPLLVVALLNIWLRAQIPRWYGATFDFSALGLNAPVVDIQKVKGVWGLELALLGGLLTLYALTATRLAPQLREGLGAAVSGSMLATLNTASEYGFGAVIAALPGFAAIKGAIGSASAHPLLNEAFSVNVLAGITGSASGGMSIALAAMGAQYLQAAQAAGISPEVLHRVAAMASGGMDTLPHNGAVITLLAITGLTHREAYADIFAITLIKTAAVFVVIGVYMLTGWV